MIRLDLPIIVKQNSSVTWNVSDAVSDDRSDGPDGCGDDDGYASRAVTVDDGRFAFSYSKGDGNCISFRLL